MGNRPSKRVTEPTIGTPLLAKTTQVEEENAPPYICGVAIDKKPMKPEDDVHEQYVWKLGNPHLPEFAEDQINGYVCGSRAFSQYIFLRKPRLTTAHRFLTVDRVRVGNAIVFLGDCKTYPSSITRDVVRIAPKGALKLHSLTCLLRDNGTENYVCSGTSLSVCYE